jgi:hypothetical protein
MKIQNGPNTEILQDNPYDSFVLNMFPMMAKKFSIMIKADMVSMKRSSFFSLLSCFMKNVLEGKCKNEKNSDTCSRELVQKHQEFSKQIKNRWVEQHLKITSKTVDKILNPYQFRH